MSHPRLSSAARRATLLAATLWLAGCAGLSPKTPEAVVTQRAEARWAYLIGGDFEKAWDLTQPGFRAVVKRDRYARRFGSGGAWTGAQVHEVTCEPERCTVRLRVSAKVATPPFTARSRAKATSSALTPSGRISAVTK